MIETQCRCGTVALQLADAPVAQLFCHCSDCQAAHGAAYAPNAIYARDAVQVLRGALTATVVKTTPRMRCAECGTHLFTEVESAGLRSVNGYLLPQGSFRAQFHIQCADALLPIRDDLPHYSGFPAVFGGSDDRVDW